MRRIIAVAAVGALVVIGTPASAQLSSEGSLSGVVTDDSGNPLSGICVYVEGWSSWRMDETAADGSYRVGDLEEDSYRVEFWDCTSQTYIGEWYDDQPFWSDADPVEVTAGEETTGIDAALTEGGRISGTVTNTDGEPLEEVCVEAYADGEPYGSGYGFTEADGIYEVRGLPSGAYRVSFYDCSWSGYESEYYDDAPDAEDATLVGVVEGNLTSGIDAVLERIESFDLGITELRVENVPLTTDAGEVGHSGWLRRIHVSVENLSFSGFGEAELDVQVCPETAGFCDWIGSHFVDLAPGERAEYTFEWNGLGDLGDVDVEADLRPYGYDDNWSNDTRSVDHYVVVGGSGVGVGT